MKKQIPITLATTLILASNFIGGMGCDKKNTSRESDSTASMQTSDDSAMVIDIDNNANIGWDDCGENPRTVWCKLDEETFTVNGNGNMKDYYYDEDGYNHPICYFVENELEGIEEKDLVESDIRKVIIDAGVTSIGKRAFEWCNNLISVTISNSVTVIGSYAFSKCDKLTSITIPGNVVSIDDYAFSYNDKLTLITITNGVASIGRNAFGSCHALRSIAIPSSVMFIGGHPFDNCQNLADISVALDNPNYSSEDGVLFNKDKTLLIQYPAGKQGTYALPSSVTTIAERAFLKCNGLTSITIPNSVISIGKNAFYGCDGLMSITIPNSVKSIAAGTFDGCTGLTSVTLGVGVSEIKDRAFNFNECNALTSITSLNPIPPKIENFFYPPNENACLYVPEGSIEAYRKRTLSWGKFDCIKSLKDAPKGD